MNSEISKITLLSVLIEGIITYFNDFFVTGEKSWQMIFSLGLGIIVAIAYGLDVTKYLDVSSKIPFVGNILTGILISRGSNYAYDLITKLISLK